MYVRACSTTLLLLTAWPIWDIQDWLKIELHSCTITKVNPLCFCRRHPILETMPFSHERNMKVSWRNSDFWPGILRSFQQLCFQWTDFGSWRHEMEPAPSFSTLMMLGTRKCRCSTSCTRFLVDHTLGIFELILRAVACLCSWNLTLLGCVDACGTLDSRSSYLINQFWPEACWCQSHVHFAPNFVYLTIFCHQEWILQFNISFNKNPKFFFSTPIFCTQQGRDDHPTAFSTGRAINWHSPLETAGWYDRCPLQTAWRRSLELADFLNSGGRMNGIDLGAIDMLQSTPDITFQCEFEKYLWLFQFGSALNFWSLKKQDLGANIPTLETTILSWVIQTLIKSMPVYSRFQRFKKKRPSLGLQRPSSCDGFLLKISTRLLFGRLCHNLAQQGPYRKDTATGKGFPKKRCCVTDFAASRATRNTTIYGVFETNVKQQIGICAKPTSDVKPVQSTKIPQKHVFASPPTQRNSPFTLLFLPIPGSTHQVSAKTCSLSLANGQKLVDRKLSVGRSGLISII